jgi:hypothetical protein
VDENTVKQEIPVEAPEPDEATALLHELTPRLSDEDAQRLANLCQTDANGALQDRSEWEARLGEWEDAYFGRTTDKEFPWPGASNFHVPITMMGVETAKPRLVEAVLGQNPPVMVVPTTQAGEDRRLKVETVLNWYVTSKLQLEPIVAQSAHLFLQPGLVVAKTYWNVDRRWRKFVREFPPQTPLPAIFEALFGSQTPRDLEKTGDLTWRGVIPTSPQGGVPLECKLKLKILEDGIQVLVEREEVDEGPKVDLVEPIDLITPAKGGHEIADLPWCAQRLWLNENDLRIKVEQGRFYADVVQDIIDEGAPKGDQPNKDSQGYRQSQDDAEGVEGQGPSNVRRLQWPILECYRRYDIDGDGFDEEIIAWVTADGPGRLLGWDYLDNVYAHGRRPLRVGRFFPIPFRFLGLSYAEMIKGIQDEINAIHNQKVDYATIQNMPFGFIRASSTLPPISQRLRPGEFIEVDNPQQDVNFPKWQGSSAWASGEEATLMQYKERLDGQTDMNMGRQPNRVGATRTAKGTQTLLSEGGLRAKGYTQAFQRFWLGIFSDMLALLQEYMPPSQEFRITGRRPTVIRVKDRTEIRGNYDLRLAATTESLNRQQMREDATVLMQALMNPSLMQAGIVGMKGIRRTVQDLLKAYGKDPDFYLEDQDVIRGPIEELMLFTIGQYVSPTTGENYDAHLKAHDQALKDPSIKPEVKRLIHRHMQETLQLKQAQQMAQALQQQRPGGPPVGQQAQNAQIGAQPQGAPGQPAPNGASPQGGMPQGVPSGR